MTVPDESPERVGRGKRAFIASALAIIITTLVMPLSLGIGVILLLAPTFWILGEAKDWIREQPPEVQSALWIVIFFLAVGEIALRGDASLVLAAGRGIARAWNEAEGCGWPCSCRDF